MPGGFSGMDFRITDALRLAVPGVFKYGANVRAKIAPGESGAGGAGEEMGGLAVSRRAASTGSAEIIANVAALCERRSF